MVTTTGLATLHAVNGYNCGAYGGSTRYGMCDTSGGSNSSSSGEHQTTTAPPKAVTGIIPPLQWIADWGWGMILGIALVASVSIASGILAFKRWRRGRSA